MLNKDYSILWIWYRVVIVMNSVVLSGNSLHSQGRQ